MDLVDDLSGSLLQLSSTGGLAYGDWPSAPNKVIRQILRINVVLVGHGGSWGSLREIADHPGSRGQRSGSGRRHRFAALRSVRRVDPGLATRSGIDHEVTLHGAWDRQHYSPGILESLAQRFKDFLLSTHASATLVSATRAMTWWLTGHYSALFSEHPETRSDWLTRSAGYRAGRRSPGRSLYLCASTFPMCPGHRVQIPAGRSGRAG